MKTKILPILTLLFMTFLGQSALSQDKEPRPEIKFEHITVDEAKALAKETGKLIFIDCYTSWCGPCKRMAATAFKSERVAKLYNENFINLKVEMEKDEDGRPLAIQYKVKAYPTLLFIDANGKLIEKRIGMQNADQLLMVGKSAIENR